MSDVEAAPEALPAGEPPGAALAGSRRKIAAAAVRGRVLLPAYLALAVILANLPARLATGVHEARSGLSLSTYLPVGMLVDLRDFLLVYALANLLLAWLGWGVLRLWRARRGTEKLRFHSVLARTVPVATSVLFAVNLVAAAMATEFRIERGLYPTMFDLEVGTGLTSLFDGTLGILRQDRFLWPVAAAVAAFALATRHAWRALPKARPFDLWREPGLLLSIAALTTASSFGLHRGAPHVLRSLPHWRVVGSAPAVFFGSTYQSANIELGALALFRRLQLPIELRAPGAQLLGFDPAAAAQLASGFDTCLPHPLAQPLDRQRTGGSAFFGDLDGALRDLSASLFRESGKPLRVWQLSLESFRGDDLHALNPDAPAEIAPETNGLYEAARSGSAAVIAAPHMYGAGARTSQGLSAMLCGLGTIPLGLSFGRDLGLLPLRCLPDVLRDASFETAFYYGSTPDFDNMRAFLNYHGIDRIISKLDFQAELWEQSWDAPDQASDRMVFERALADSAARAPDHAQYNLVMSLTNHFPFVLPEDAAPEVRSRVDRAMQLASDYSLSQSDRARIETFSYTDHVLGALLESLSLSADADRTIVVLAADHSTGHARVWGQGPSAPRDKVAFARIPFLVVFPKALVQSAPDPEAARAHLARINRLLAEHVLSQNDIPRIVLAILAASPELSSLPAGWRWHSLGGQRSSPHFRPPDASAAVVGIDGRTRIVLAHDDPPSALPLDVPIQPTLDPALVAEHDPHLLPAAAFLSAFVQSYGDRCWQVSNIRSTP